MLTADLGAVLGTDANIMCFGNRMQLTALFNRRRYEAATRLGLQFVLKRCELFIEASQVRIFIIKAAGCPVSSFQQKINKKAFCVSGQFSSWNIESPSKFFFLCRCTSLLNQLFSTSGPTGAPLFTKIVIFISKCAQDFT